MSKGDLRDPFRELPATAKREAELFEANRLLHQDIVAFFNSTIECFTALHNVGRLQKFQPNKYMLLIQIFERLRFALRSAYNIGVKLLQSFDRRREAANSKQLGRFAQLQARQERETYESYKLVHSKHRDTRSHLFSHTYHLFDDVDNIINGIERKKHKKPASTLQMLRSILDKKV